MERWEADGRPKEERREVRPSGQGWLCSCPFSVPLSGVLFFCSLFHGKGRRLLYPLLARPITQAALMGDGAARPRMELVRVER